MNSHRRAAFLLAVLLLIASPLAAGAQTVAPGRAAPVSPSGPIATNTPTFSWLAASDVSYYLLSLTDASASSPISLWYTPAQAGCSSGAGACTITITQGLTSGLVSWAVLTWNPAGYGGWSTTLNFVVDLQDPTAPTPLAVAPTGSIGTNSPTYSWQTAEGANWYQIEVTTQWSANDFWYAPAAVCVTASCAATPPLVLPSGPASWRLRMWTIQGAGPWSAPLAFETAATVPGPVTSLSPAGPVTTATPTFTWNAQPSAGYYLLRVTDWPGVSVDRWYQPVAVGCLFGSVVCSASPAEPLAPGPATWQVLGWSPAGYGPWSDIRTFSVEIPDVLALAPQPVSPTGYVSEPTPTYIWDAVPGAVLYRLSISNNGNPAALSWHTPGVAGCSAATSQCSVTPPGGLANGTAEWRVQTWTADGHSAWSATVAFSVGISLPDAPTAISPDGPTGPIPTFAWSASQNVTYYYLRVDDLSGNRVAAWLTPPQVGCSSGTGTCSFTPAVALRYGAAEWRVLAWNAIGYSPWSATLAFTVSPPPTLALSANPTTVANGAASTLTWTTTNATGCTASGAWTGPRAVSGSESTGALFTSGTFDLTCAGPGGTVTQSVALTVLPGPVISFTAQPGRVANGGSTTLSWSVVSGDSTTLLSNGSDATSCTASGGWSGSKGTSGSQSISLITAATIFTLTCTGTSGSTSSSITVDLKPASAIFPLRVEAGTRHLVDAEGQPFLIHGDTASSLIVQLTREEVDLYLENRRLKGFNTIFVNLIERHFADDPPNNAYGDQPFLVRNDFSTPNEAYFAHAEYVIGKAAEKGILVMLMPAYLGSHGVSQGWYRALLANGTTKLRAYGQYLATRSQTHDNVLWVHGGDYNPPNRDVMRAIVNGINDLDVRWLHTFEGSRGTAALEFLGASDAWIQVNTIHSKLQTVVDDALREYARSTMPFVLIEGRYERDENESGKAQDVRLQAYQAVLSGASGQMMGNSKVWEFARGWQRALNSEGAQTMVHLRALLESRPWWALQPDTTHAVLENGFRNGATQAPAAIAADRSYAIAYLPSGRTVTVDLGQLAGPRVAARWYDPTTGTDSAVDGSPFAATGPRRFTPPGRNAGGMRDWVLDLQSVP